MAMLMVGTAEAKSVYLVADHWYQTFDAWNINPDGTITYQTTHGLTCTSDPAGIAVYEWFGPDATWDTADDLKALFLTSEFAAGFAVVDGETMAEIACVTSGLPGDLADVDVDEPDPATGDAHVFTIQRGDNDLYVFDWDAATMAATNRGTIALPNCSGAIGLALNEFTGVLYVGDTWGGVVRGYTLDLTAMAATEVMTPWNPTEGPVDVALDRARGILYTGAADSSCAYGAGGGSGVLCKYDIASGTETAHDTGSAGIMGIAVDEVTGYVYVTHGCSGDMLTVWDTSTSPFTQLQNTGDIGNPAGIAIGQRTGIDPLNFFKDDGLADDACENAGATVTYSMCFDNTNNPNQAATGVVIVDDLPSDVSFVSATGGGVYDSGTHTVTWDVGTLPGGAAQQCLQATVQVNGGVTPLTVLTNYATIDSNETPPVTEDEQTQVCEPSPCGDCLQSISLQSPADGSTPGAAPTFCWQPCGGTQPYYAIEFAGSRSGPFFGKAILTKGETCWTMPLALWNSLPTGATKYWRVRGLDKACDPKNVIVSDEVWSVTK
jgi:uncharacterized repeat protein (TIGR01451 family)